MNRAPIYAKDGNQYPQFRIVSRPGGLWVLQKHTGGKGRNKTKNPAAPHYDPWDDRSPAVSFNEAKAFILDIELAASVAVKKEAA